MEFYRNCLFFVGALLFLFQESMGQNQVLTGRIYDLQTRQSLSNASIQDDRGLELARSDASGNFILKERPSANQLKVILPGYLIQTVKIEQGIAELNIQLEADAVRLNEVRVSAYNTNKTIQETAGAITLVTARDIGRGSAVSFQPAFNAIAGVRMDQSTLSEARISIRGNGVRSAFGIRNLKIYINEIPVTEADGTTRIEALDVNSIGRAEVIKGPVSSIYGAGTGGVINFQLQRSPYQEQSLEVSGIAGANGLHRIATTYRSGGDKLNSYVAYGWQEYAGYRAHSKDMRRFLTGNFQLFPSDRRVVTLLLNRTTQYSEIPGSLTAAQVAVNPLQANPVNLDKAAGRYQNWTRIGLGQQYHFNGQLENITSVFTYFYDLNHPLPYAYIRNFYQSYGGRSRFNYDPGFKRLSTVFTLGGEFNEGRTKGAQYVNNQGKEGAINSNIDYRNTLHSLFYQSETRLGAYTSLVLGLSYNSLRYDITDYQKQNQSGIKKFDPQASPRIALSHKFSNALSLHASMSSGFSPPSGSEIKNVDGSVNPRLQAEKGINYELNAKGNLLKSRLEYDLAIFKMNMKGELIAQAIQQGITVYNNAGKTSHNGTELSVSYQILNEEDHRLLNIVRPFAAITYSDFKFRDYKKLGAQGQVTETYDGNILTGVAPWVLNVGLDLETRLGIYAFGNYFYSDHLPLNDSNTAFNGSYRVVNGKIGYKTRINRWFELNAYAGLDNIFGEKYSSIVSLNATASGDVQPAYFNPSPGRNGYGGLSLKYLF